MPLLAHVMWDDLGAAGWTTLLLTGAFVAWTIWRAVLYTLSPGETEPDHIKRMILREPLSVAVDMSETGATDDV